MDRTLKERLIGAAVLVALGVWLIPWVLDGPDERPAENTDVDVLSLPAPGDGAEARRTQTVEVNVGRSESDGPIPGASGGGDEPPAREPIALAGTDEAPHARTVEPPQRTVASPASDAGVAAEPETAGGSDGAAGWWVQLGSFGDEDNARRQSSRVSDYGYEPRITNYLASGRMMYRVRVGPLETRASAEAAASSLSAHGFVPQLVAPE